MSPIFSQPLTTAISAPVQTTLAATLQKTTSTQQLATKTLIKRKPDELGTPSISQALAGKFVEEKKTEIKAPEKYANEAKKIDKPFTSDELQNIWPHFSDKYSDQVHLYNTLSIKPILLPNFLVKFEVENSVQQDQFRSLKPEIIGYLRRNLHNDAIDVHIEIVKTVSEFKVLTEDQKLKAMLQKNPALQLFKNRFNLDFNS